MLYLAGQLVALVAEGQQSKQDPDLFLLSPYSRCVFLVTCLRSLSLPLWVDGDSGSCNNIDY